MSITKSEYLSAILDGEAGEFEQRRILDEVEKDQDLQASLSCYALIGETMRDEKQEIILGSDFLKSIHDQIDEEPAYSHVQIEEKAVSNKPSVWVRPVAGFAMVASVAAIAVFGMQSMMVENRLDAPLASLEKVSPVSTVVAKADVYHHPNEEMKTLYKRYLDSHVQYASTNSMVPSVRVASYNSSY